MATYISRKLAWLKCLISVICASGTVFLLSFLLEGPRLSSYYDFLLRQRSSVPVSQELLIIDVPGQEYGEDILEPGAASILLYILTELGARSLIVQIPILGHAAGGTVGEAEIIHRFDEEFSILSRNISNLFDAIRTGSVAPRDSARFVGELVELSEQGMERLVSALVLRDMEGIANLERAAAFFGDVMQPEDVRVMLIRAGDSAEARAEAMLVEDVYSRVPRDNDGVLRRIAPVLRDQDHIIFRALKTQFNNLEITYSEAGDYISSMRTAADNEARHINLDRNGAVLFEIPGSDDDFRRIGISEFLAYEEADRNLRRLLSEAESLNLFRGIDGERRPDFLYDFAFVIREEFSASREFYGRQLWIEARNRYFASLLDFLEGPSELSIVSELDLIMADEYRNIFTEDYFNDARYFESADRRNQIVTYFIVLREAHSELINLREKLEDALFNSFCILGRGSYSGTSLTNVEASALLANSILTGRVINPFPKLYLQIISIAVALLVCLLIRYTNALPALLLGTALTLLTAVGFSVGFVISGYWLDPLIPAASVFTGVVTTFLWVLSARNRYSKRFRIAYGPFIPKTYLKSIIRAGKPLTTQSHMVRSAVVALTNSEPGIDQSEPQYRTKIVLDFQSAASELLKKAGATIIDLEEKTVTACFGSPIERVYLEEKNIQSLYNDNNFAKAAPAMKAMEVVSVIVRLPEARHWNFGMDLGNCEFAWSSSAGYFALGETVLKAKVLSRLGERFKQKILISEAMNISLPDLTTRKIQAFKNKDGTTGEHFFGVKAAE